MAGSPDSLTSAVTSRTFATVGSGINCLTEKGRPCRRVRVGAAGNIALVYADGSTDTVTGLVAGESIDVQASQIAAAGTTAAQITVFW